jgi:glycosyltransferase involved in cell wall biosynthesis
VIMPAERPLRITAIIDDNAVSGKTQPIVSFAKEAHARSVPPREIEVSIVAFSRRGAARNLASLLRAEGLDVRLLEERRAFDWRVVEKLKALLSETAADIVWTHSSKTHFLAALSNVRGDRRWVAFHHGYTSTSLRWRAYQLLDRWSLMRAESVIVPCDAFRAQMEHLGIPPRIVRVCPTPNVSRPSADRTRVDRPREALGISARSKVVLSVGRLSKEKRQDVLIRSFGALRRATRFGDAVLVLVGSGPERAGLGRLVHRLGLDGSVIFAGQRDDVSSFYAMADVFVLSSDTEGTPNVILEAMNAGIPIVATKAGGLVEMLEDRRSGLLLSCGDVDGMTACIAAILSDPSAAASLATLARKQLRRYAPGRHYATLRSAFQEVAGW